MKRGIICSVRTSKDSKTGEINAWISIAVMPTKMNNGGLFFPKSSDILVNTVAGEIKNPDKFNKYKSFKLGDIVEVAFALNEFTQKPFVNEVSLVQETPYKDADLIV